MKTPAILPASFFFFFLLFAFTTTAKIALDSDGDLMYNGGTYYMRPIEPYGGDAIFAAAIRHGESDDCSLAVVAGPSSNGWATTIATLVRPTFLLTNYAAIISFNYVAPNICTNSSNWVVQKSPSLGREAVMLASSQDAWKLSTFKVVPYGTDDNSYKLVFCGSSDECRNIGVHVDKEQKYKRLVVTDGEPLVVKFDKVIQPFASHVSMVV